MIIHAGIALGVTLVVLTIVLAVLQYRERVRVPCLYQSMLLTHVFFAARWKMIVSERNNRKPFIMMPCE